MRNYAKEIEQHGVVYLKTDYHGIPCWVVMTKNLKQDRKEPYLFLITNHENPNDALEQYAQRWKIECCFRHLKSNGFDIEAMNFEDDKKIELMMGVVVTSYALAVREGILSHLKKPIRMKKYRNGKQYFEISVFRKGIEIIEESLTNIVTFVRYVMDIIFDNNRKTLITINI